MKPAPAQAPANVTGARAISAAAGAPQPISSKDALNKLSAQAPVLQRAVEQQSIILQTSRGLATALRQGDGTVTLSLQPPRLGQLKVHITVQDSMISARIEPSTETARQLLVGSEHSLRAALEARGLSVERIEIEAAKPPPHANDPAPPPEASHAKDEGLQPDHPGGENAGAWTRGDSAGSGAEAHTGDARHDAEASGPGGAAPLGTGELSYVLDGGGTYRLRLDALA